MKTFKARYKSLYAQIQNYAAADELAGLHQGRFHRNVNALDFAFGNYLSEAFIQAGLTLEEANEATDFFGVAFRTARNSGLSLNDSYQNAVDSLRATKPELMELIDD